MSKNPFVIICSRNRDPVTANQNLMNEVNVALEQRYKLIGHPYSVPDPDGYNAVVCQALMCPSAE